MEKIEIEAVGTVTTPLADAVAALVSQLSSSARRPTADELSDLVASPATTLLVARSGARIVGMLTLVLVRIPTGMRAMIEDVVVDASGRGRGIGEALTRAAMARARSGGARTIDLTSRPSREAANRLYQRLGFVLRDTRVFRFALESEPG